MEAVHLFSSRSYILKRAITIGIVLNYRFKSPFHKNSGREETHGFMRILCLSYGTQVTVTQLAQFFKIVL